jgi:hypothetical protein
MGGTSDGGSSVARIGRGLWGRKYRIHVRVAIIVASSIREPHGGSTSLLQELVRAAVEWGALSSCTLAPPAGAALACPLSCIARGGRVQLNGSRFRSEGSKSSNEASELEVVVVDDLRRA